jgi:magnesium transporter
MRRSRRIVAPTRDAAREVADGRIELAGERLTAVASIILLPTLIVGLYGQNFDHLPELHWWWGYYYSLGLILVTTLAQLASFRWKRWL